MKHDIEKLLQRFLDGVTTLEEERYLGDYFRTHEVSGELRAWKEMFAYFDNGMEEDIDEMEDERLRMKDEVTSRSKPISNLLSLNSHLRRWHVASVAAVLAVAVGTALLGPRFQSSNSPFSTHTTTEVSPTAISIQSDENTRSNYLNGGEDYISSEKKDDKQTIHEPDKMLAPQMADGITEEDYEVVELAVATGWFSEPAYTRSESAPIYRDDIDTKDADILDAVDTEVDLSEPEIRTLIPQSERISWLSDRYRMGYKPAMVDDFSPFFDPLQAVYIGEKAVEFQRTGDVDQTEYFGLVKEDDRGIYVPWIRHLDLDRPRNDSFDNGRTEKWMQEYLRLADVANDTIHIVETDSETGETHIRFVFAFNGKLGNKKKAYYGGLKPQPDSSASSFWWGWVELKKDRFIVHLHAIDKLYASECPDIKKRSMPVDGYVYSNYNGNIEPAFTAMVKIAGTDERVIANSKGHFAMHLPHKNTHLQVVYIGWKIPTLKAKPKMKIILKDAGVTIH